MFNDANYNLSGQDTTLRTTRLVDAFGIYEDVACVAISEMMEQGFTDHDIVDALFAPATGGRRFSTHNAGPCALPLIGDREEGS